MREHAAYWQDLTDKGLAIAFGPVMNPKGPWGVGMVGVDSEADARFISGNDPFIKANTNFSVEILPMRIGAVRRNP